MRRRLVLLAAGILAGVAAAQIHRSRRARKLPGVTIPRARRLTDEERELSPGVLDGATQIVEGWFAQGRRVSGPDEADTGQLDFYDDDDVLVSRTTLRIGPGGE